MGCFDGWVIQRKICREKSQIFEVQQAHTGMILVKVTPRLVVNMLHHGTTQLLCCLWVVGKVWINVTLNHRWAVKLHYLNSHQEGQNSMC